MGTLSVLCFLAGVGACIALIEEDPTYSRSIWALTMVFSFSASYWSFRRATRGPFPYESGGDKERVESEILLSSDVYQYAGEDPDTQRLLRAEWRVYGRLLDPKERRGLRAIDVKPAQRRPQKLSTARDGAQIRKRAAGRAKRTQAQREHRPPAPGRPATPVPVVPAAPESSERLRRVSVFSRASLRVMPKGEYLTWRKRFNEKLTPREARRLMEAFRAAHKAGTIDGSELAYLMDCLSDIKSLKGTDERSNTVMIYTQIMPGGVDVKIPADYLQVLTDEERAQVPESWIRR